MGEVPSPAHVSVDPEPSDDELAAILVAYDQLWPAPLDAAQRTEASRRWRFQGRWWLDQPERRPPTGWR